MAEGNGNTDRLLGQLMAKVDGMRDDIKELKADHHDRLDNHAARIAVLEKDKNNRDGGARVLSMLLGGAVVVGGLLSQILGFVIGKIWAP